VDQNALLCKNCSHPMPLQPPTHLGISSDQRYWPSDGASRIFLCPECKHAYEYTAQDLRDLPFETMVRSRGCKPRSVVCVELPCGVGGCEAQLRIHTLVAFDAGLHEAATKEIQRAFAHQILCSWGHPVSGSFSNRTNFDAYLDPDWGPEFSPCP
jgi:hypothetical protein